MSLADTKRVLDARKLIGGEKSNLMMVRPVKHRWARDLLGVMMDNTWTHHEVDLSEDAKAFATGVLADGELKAYRKALAFLSNLDGIQLNNITNNINRWVTSPEVNQCLVRQAWEEALHVESYAQMIESIGFDPIEIYWMFEKDEILARKNEHIMEQSRLLGDDYSVPNFIKAVAANIALEGVYFFSGFLVFYTLSRMGKMRGSAKMIKLIQRDEAGTHLKLFQGMWETLRTEHPEAFTGELLSQVKQIFRNAAEMEIAWGKHIISDGVLGLTDAIITDFVRYLCDQRLESIGLEKMFDAKNPVPWFDKYSQVNDADQNFFETKVDSYGATMDW